MSEKTLSNVPEWAKDAVFYQIFPDRFAMSERVVKPSNLHPWDAEPHHQKYQGGDLYGVIEKLDYLADLGINALYFNPIFQSASNHRYHTHDYYNVCPLLGGNDALRELIQEAHARNMRVMLDGVFNHSSRGFFQFNDILENGPHSPWLNWFYIEDWPLAAYRGDIPANYVGWFDQRALPKFNTDNPQVREYLMEVAEFWVREYDIDGWRLDVAAEIKTPGFWEEFRQRVRAIKPDLYIVGEIWHIAPEWLKGDRFDANMHYPMTAAITAFAGGEHVSETLAADRGYNPYPGIGAAEFGRQINHLLEVYDWETTQVCYNQLDSHDTPRFLSLVRGDKASLRLATLFQMTYPGAPSIYYGNEIGIRGTSEYDSPHRDEDARWTFPWDDQSRWDYELLAYFKEVIALRHACVAFRRGRYQQLYASGQTFAFLRQDSDTAATVLLNADNQVQTAHIDLAQCQVDGLDLSIAFGSGRIIAVSSDHITIEVPARTGLVLMS